MERQLAAVLAADMVGFSRLMEKDEDNVLLRQKTLRHELVDPEIARHRGRIVKTTGDGVLGSGPINPAGRLGVDNASLPKLFYDEFCPRCIA